ncbi:ribose-5-phosphate isomerase [Microbacterium sp. 4R-513]|uniref:ribose-5-phosphate isomerase n=1 Tax=Microbacterium sp. 4R-513 TaxID=2567934 RepID=UPI0013E1138B|nr:ribose-5-phosphate isomerase [Microbacterium sp. 4R-513]QIG40528.1 ribose-5-phosphate isomerase [Microbacterium sp. 4R-513]
MRIHIATDHAGLEFSTQLQHHLAGAGHDVVDHGPLDYEPLDDYPAFCIRAAQAVVRDQAAGMQSLGVVFGGSGNGEQIAANKVEGVRAALVWSIATAELAREHNDANVIAIGARQHTFEEAASFIDRFIATPFSNEERHIRRIHQIADFERDGSLVPDPRAGGALSAPTGGESADAMDPEAG